MIIRDAQVNMLADDLSNKELMRYARARFPTYFESRSPDQLARFCNAARALALKLGITHEADVATVLDLAVMYGARFYEASWARDVFLVSDWSGGEKIRVIRSRIKKQIP